MGLHRPDREVERDGDLLVRLVLDEAELNAGAVGGTQLRDRLGDRRAELARLERLERGGAVGGHLDRPLGRRLEAFGAAIAVERDRLRGAPPEMVDRGVVRDPEEPTRELQFGPIGVEPVQGPDEGVLRELLGDFAVPDHPEHEGEDGPLIALDERARPRVAPTERELDQFDIGELGEVGAHREGEGRRAELDTPRTSGAPQRFRGRASTRRTSAANLSHGGAPGQLSPMSATIDLERHEAEAAAANATLEGKRVYVRRMFSEIAPSYDLLNRLLSLGIDRRWRTVALRRLGWDRAPSGTYLDLCAGTLDVGTQLSKTRGFFGRILAADFAEPMLRAGVGKASPAVLAPAVADALALPVRDAAFEGAIVAFGIRNVADLGAGLREVRRVLKPSARFVILEFSTPTLPFIRSAYQFYFHHVLPRIGRLVSGHRTAYTYLPRSVANFPETTALAQAMRDAGFRDVSWETLTFGIAAIHVGTA